MNRIVDNAISARILYLLTQPFDKTEAFHLGIIDAKGEVLKTPETESEKDAYNSLHRIVFKLKKLLGKLPGGSSNLASVAAAYLLVKESIETEWDPAFPLIALEERYYQLSSADYNYVKRLYEDFATATIASPAIAPGPGQEPPVSKYAQRNWKAKKGNDIIRRKTFKEFSDVANINKS